MDRNQTLLGLVLFIGGATVLLFGFLQFQNARESSDWPNVKGQVLSSDVERRRYRSIDGTITGNTYLPRVVYIYSVNISGDDGTTPVLLSKIPETQLARSDEGT